MPHAYEEYLEEGRFYPIGSPVNIRGRRRVIITVLDEPIQEPNEKPQAKAWREFFEVVNTSDEKVPEEFEKVNFTREGTL
ncbi:MAG: hypothetical protein LBB91_04855 [Clostridiales bacterium]|jgi:hypothetical protein|nr:hypothetical protein [Clostridiales bacterium]